MKTVVIIFPQAKDKELQYIIFWHHS